MKNETTAKPELWRGSILDRSAFTRRFITRLASHPWTLLPFLGGITDLLALWTFNIQSPPAAFAGLAAVLLSLGVFLTRVVTGSENVAKQVLEDMEKEAVRQRERTLDDLDRKLSADGDSRTEKCLRDLRALAGAFQRDKAWLSTLNTRSTFDILSGVEQLFMRCVQYLEKTLQLWYTARDMSTPEARDVILAERERILEDVTASIRQLGKILAGIQRLGVSEGEAGSDLARIRDELDQSLEVAKAVEKRMKDLERELETEV
jgi:hypothetical protein